MSEFIQLRSLKGHQGAVTCCRSDHNLLLSGDEVGLLTIHDMRTSQAPVVTAHLHASSPQPEVAAVVWHPTQPCTAAFCAQGASVHVLDFRKVSLASTFKGPANKGACGSLPVATSAAAGSGSTVAPHRNACWPSGAKCDAHASLEQQCLAPAGPQGTAAARAGQVIQAAMSGQRPNSVAERACERELDALLEGSSHIHHEPAVVAWPAAWESECVPAATKAALPNLQPPGACIPQIYGDSRGTNGDLSGAGLAGCNSGHKRRPYRVAEENASRCGVERSCVVKTLTYNQEDISCLAVNGKGTYLVAGDDGGQAKVYELRHHSVMSTLRTAQGLGLGGAAFLQSGAQRRVVTGGMDCTVATWDAATGAGHAALDLREDAAARDNSLPCVNPPMAHALAVPASADGLLHGCQMDAVNREKGACRVAVARGDGAISVLDPTAALSAHKLSLPRHAASRARKPHLKRAMRGSRSRENGARSLKMSARGDEASGKVSSGSVTGCVQTGESHGRNVDISNGLQTCCPGAVGVLGGSGDGHAAAAGAAAFLGSPWGHLLVSGGDDRNLMVWDVGRCVQGCCSPAVCAWRHGRKVNAITACMGGGAAFAIADTSSVLRLYAPRG